jgi:hypothetical protein
MRNESTPRYTPAEIAHARQIAATAGRICTNWSDLIAARQSLRRQSEARQSIPSHPAPAQIEPTHPRANLCQSAPNSAKARHEGKNEKTNPPAIPTVRTRPPRPLTPDQLRAAHLLFAGQSTTTIAATLQINRHTLARWKRHPLFEQELRHLLAAGRAPHPPAGTISSRSEHATRGGKP